MHWSDKLAETLIETRPDRDPYVLAAGISPSGPVHIGNFRDVATTYFVGRALRERGRNVRLLFSWDEFDRFRKVPADVDPAWKAHLGKPYKEVPDPWGCHESYADHFESAFMESMGELGIELEFRRQAALYRSGIYAEGIAHAIRERKRIYDILMSFKSQDATESDRENYWPVAVYCEECGKDACLPSEVSDDGYKLRYTCGCMYWGKADLREGPPIKLAWKIDWPMRWKHEGVDFEPGGRDHASAGGSYEVASRIAREIYGIEPPLFQPYDFILLAGENKKMSGSAGGVLTPGELLKIYQPEVLRWIFAKYNPIKQFKIFLDDQILRQYDEYDRFRENLKSGKVGPEDARAVELAAIPGREPAPVSFRQLAGFSSVVQGNLDAIEEMFRRVGTPYTRDQFAERLAKAEHWMLEYCPESAVVLLDAPAKDEYEALSEEEQGWVAALRKFVEGGLGDLDEATTVLYAIPKIEDAEDKANKTRQRRFFQIVYRLLIGRDQGPRLATFLTALGPERVLPLLEF